MQLDRNTIHWDNTGLGLHKTPGAFVNAKLRQKSIETIPTHSRQTTACTVSKHTNSIWSQETICNARITCTSVSGQGQTVHPTSVQQILIPRQSSGQHPTLPDQRHCITIIQTNQRHDAADPSTPQLSGHAGRCRAILPRKRHGISSTQQCKLLEQTQSTQQGRGTLLSFK